MTRILRAVYASADKLLSVRTENEVRHYVIGRNPELVGLPGDQAFDVYAAEVGGDGFVNLEIPCGVWETTGGYTGKADGRLHFPKV